MVRAPERFAGLAIAIALAGSAPVWADEIEVEPRPRRPDPAAFVLAAPPPVMSEPLRVLAPLPRGDEGDAYVLATEFDAPVWLSTRKDTWGLGVLRRGSVLLATVRSSSAGCSGGRWAALRSGGVVCSTDGVEILDAMPVPARLTLAPDLGSPLPYRYAKVAEGAPLFDRLPTAEQERAVDDGARPPGIAAEITSGVRFIALDRPVDRDGTEFHRSLEGEVVRTEDLAMVEPPRMRGQPIIEADLPIAFVHAADTQAFSLDAGSPAPIGTVQRFARFVVAEERVVDDAPWVVAEQGFAVPRTAVRVARRIRRPSGVDADDRWIHVHLPEQTLVAYAGDEPVYATLVSSGRPGYETPDGLYRIRRKYISRRMQGPDPDHGTYDIAEVPWTMYYYAGLALHGAYWHDEFGRTRSHGCTNVSPVDARWLFRFTAPAVPDGWHGVHRAGSWIYFTEA